jgi:hypothetical protein
MNRGSLSNQSQTQNGISSNRRLFLQAAAVSAGATLALALSTGLSPLALQARDVPAQEDAGILYRESDRLLYDGEILGAWRVTVRPEPPAVEDSK